MKKYNYFDDEPEELETVRRKAVNRKRIQPDFSKFAGNARQSIEDFIHGNTFEDLKEIKEMPYLKAAILKITAFTLFILTIIIFVIVFSHSISSQNKKNEQFYTDAGKVCTDYLTDYGIVKWERLDSDEYGSGMTRLTGLCYARQMDFNNDGSDELMLCYNNKNVYTLEVWGYVGKQFSKLYSEEANRTEDSRDGSWIAFYYKNNKYYICKSSPDTPQEVKFYALKGDSFKEDSGCDYDYKNDIYSVKGKINAEDFETIKLSVIKASKAELISDTVTANIDSFNTVSMAVINTQKSEEELKAEAYYKIIEGRNEKYGKAKISNDKGSPYIEGLAIADLVDFDGDGNEELLLVFRKMLKESATNAYNGQRIIIEEPTYCIEVYSWNGTVTKKIFSRDSVSNYLSDSSVNYIMLENNDGTANICVNNYSYKSERNYTASSRIYECKDGEFDCTFSAREENSYGYKNYYLDGKYVYSSAFSAAAYRVPKVMNDNDDYDKSKYSLIYLSGKSSGADLENTIRDTVETIEGLNKNYVPE